MKKLVLTLAIVAMATITAIAQEQTFEFPGWGCKDVEVLQAQLALAPYNSMKIVLTSHIDFAQNGAPVTFADACARIDTAINAINAEMAAEQKIDIKKKYAYCTGQFLPELIAYCKANPSSYDFHVALRDKTDWGYVTVSESLLKYKYSPAVARQAVDYLNRQAIALDKEDAEVFDLLKKLNRVFSAKLIEDKEAWGGVVAQIRTMMETYK